eukprot:1368970-Rhodomonas_salina.2
MRIVRCGEGAGTEFAGQGEQSSEALVPKKPAGHTHTYEPCPTTLRELRTNARGAPSRGGTSVLRHSAPAPTWHQQHDVRTRVGSRESGRERAGRRAHDASVGARRALVAVRAAIHAVVVEPRLARAREAAVR